MATSGRKAKIADSEWERHKGKILDLYLTQNLTLNELVKEMKGQLIASPSQFEAQLKAWNARKSLKDYEWEAVFNAIDKLPRGKRSRVTISGHPVSDRKIQRARRNYMSQSSNRKSRRLGNGIHNPHDIEQVSIQILEPDETWSTLSSTFDDECAARGHNIQISPGPQEQDSRMGESDTNDFTVENLNEPTLDNTNLPSTHFNILGFNATESPRRESIAPLAQESSKFLSQSQAGVYLEPTDQLHTEGQSTSLTNALSPTRNIESRACITPFMFYLSNTWLEDLPSRRFENGMKLRGLRPSNTRTDRNVSGQASPVSSLWADLLVDVFPSGEGLSESPSQTGQLNPEFRSRAFEHLKQRIDPEGNDYRDYTMISTNEIEETEFIRIILCSIMNGFAGLDGIPLDRIVKFLGRFQSVHSLLVEALRACRSYAAQALAENLFRAAIIADEAQVVSQLLETGLFGVNDTFCIHNGRKSTPIETASRLWNLSVIKALLHHKAYVNKIYYHWYSKGALNEFLDSLKTKSGIASDWVEIVDILLNAGAKVDTHLLGYAYGRLDLNLISQMLTKVSPEDHCQLISYRHFENVAQYFDDSKAAKYVALLLEDCERMHDKQCFVDCSRTISDSVTKALIIGARRGSFSFVKTLLPYGNPKIVPWILSASIRSGRADLIEHILEMNPDFQQREGFIFKSIHLPLDLSDLSYSPLAEAVLARNDPLVRRLEEAGALARLNRERLEPIIGAAYKIGDRQYVRRVLSHFPIPRLEDLTFVLYHAIKNGDESMAFELLDAGTDVNSGGGDLFPLDAAIEQNNSRLVRAILSADVHGHVDDLPNRNTPNLDQLMELIRWGNRSILTDFITSFPYATIYKESIIKLQKEAKIDQLIANLEPLDSDFFNFLMEFVFVTREGLNICLKVAIRKRDEDLMKEALERGADPSQVLELATREYPDMLPILLMQITDGIQPVVNESAMPALITAIEGGPGNIGVLDSLLRTRLFNLSQEFITLRSGRGQFSTPLGMAIREAENYHNPNFSVIKRLLDAGSNVNSIAEYTTYGTAASKTALLLTIEAEDKDLVQLLIDHGADVNAQALLTVKRTPLQRAAEIGSLSIVRLLLDHGAEVNAKPATRGGGTALQFAATSGICTIAAELLAWGASLYALPSKINGKWPLEGAAEKGRLDMIEFLWKAHQNTTVLQPCSTGFEPERCQRAMQLAEENGYSPCRDLIADLTKCTSRAADFLSDDTFCGLGNQAPSLSF
ncbi:hypothetical protein F4776DRAFT_629161 [Hypoxylon sp. NC0597]|nr:hypothetical protein F4776DRAFT_629161 [Hypoxylon sp. NC0597]